MVSAALITTLLRESKTIAVVGFSANPARPSHDVARFLQRAGYRVLPVNPGLAGQTHLGELTYASLRDIPFPVDLVDIFRKAEDMPPIIDDAIANGAKAIWMQLGIVNEEAAAKAEAAGLKVVMNLCTKIEYARIQ